jgi:hypothetical protein
MESTDSERIRQLKLTAKWSSDNYEKKKAISQLLQYGDGGLPAIQEILVITAYDDIRQACIDAISSLGMDQKSNQVFKIKTKAVGTKTKRNAMKGKHQKRKVKQAKK